MTTQIDHVEVRWRPTTSQGPFQTQKIPPTQGVVTITGVERGVQYDVQARSVSPRGTASDWVQVQHIVSAANTPLAAPTTLSAVSVADGVHLNWLTGETVLRSDLEFEVWRAPDASGSPGAFALLTTIRGTAFTDGVTDGVLRWYEVREKDQQGNYSAFAAAISSTGKTVDNGATNSFVEGQNLLINPSAGAGDTGWTNAAAGFTPTLDPSGGGFEWLNTSNAGNKHSDNIPIGPGVPIALSADMLTAGITAGQLILVAPCYNAAGTYLGQAAVIPPNGAAWSRYSSAAFTTPANTASIIVSFYLNGATNTNCGVRRIKLEVGTSATPYNDLGTQLGNQLTQAGSGVQVADQRNLLPILSAGAQAVWQNLSITYTAAAGSPATATISVSAAQILGLIAAGGLVSYNASSLSITGTGTFTYYLYYLDPTCSGGTQTLHSTGAPNGLRGQLGIVYIGSVTVTFPTSGSGSGSGGGGLCVTDSMWINGDLQAGEAVPGDVFDCVDFPTGRYKHTRRLLSVTRGEEHCVRIVTDAGAALVCSISTPFDLPDGRTRLAPDMLGEYVLTDHGIERVASVTGAGRQPVSRIHLGGVSYAAGVDPTHRIYSHNSTSKP